MSRFLFGLGGKLIILPSLVFKTTATQRKIACVFGEGPGKLLIGMVVAKKEKNQKNQKIQQKKSKKFKKIQKIIKKHGVRIFACEPGSVLGYLITLLCTALVCIFKWQILLLRGCLFVSSRKNAGLGLQSVLYTPPPPPSLSPISILLLLISCTAYTLTN